MAPVRLLTWNVGGAIARLGDDEVCSDVLQGADVLGFTETGASVAEAPAHIEGFECAAWAPRPHAHHAGGVACYVRQDWHTYTEVMAVQGEEGRCLVMVHLPRRKPFAVCVCYVPCPQSPVWQRPAGDERALAMQGWLNSLAALLNAHVPGHNVVLLGDFNARLGALRECEEGRWRCQKLWGRAPQHCYACPLVPHPCPR